MKFWLGIRAAWNWNNRHSEIFCKIHDVRNMGILTLNCVGCSLKWNASIGCKTCTMVCSCKCSRALVNNVFINKLVIGYNCELWWNERKSHPHSMVNETWSVFQTWCVGCQDCCRPLGLLGARVPSTFTSTSSARKRYTSAFKSIGVWVSHTIASTNETLQLQDLVGDTSWLASKPVAFWHVLWYTDVPILSWLKTNFPSGVKIGWLTAMPLIPTYLSLHIPWCKLQIHRPFRPAFICR